MEVGPTSGSPKRARRAFWILVLIAVLASGSLSAALTAQPGPITGVRVAASGLMLLGSLALATRVAVALERARRRALRPSANPGRRPPA
jgi:hypothetical protein